MRTFEQKKTQRTSPTNLMRRGRSFFAASHATHPILRLQRTIGNQAVLRVLQPREPRSEPVLSSAMASKFRRESNPISIYDQRFPLMRQTPPTEGQHASPDAAQGSTGTSVVSDQRLKKSGSGLTGNQLGPVDLYTYRMNGVELQFDINPAAARLYRNLRPRQWSGTEAIWIKRGHLIQGNWHLKHHSRGTGDDSPTSDNVVASNKVIAFYDSPGPNVAKYLKSRPSRIHVIQNFTSWIEGEPLNGGPAKRLNEVLAWYSVVSIADENWGEEGKTPKWVRLYGNRVGTGWTNTKTHPQV